MVNIRRSLNLKAYSIMVKKHQIRITIWILTLLCNLSLNAQSNSLLLSIVDDTNGDKTPARVEIRDQQNNFYIADDALPAGGDCDLSDIGAQLTDLESTLKLFKKEIVYPYHNSIQFYTDGSSTVTNLPDTIYVTVFKGSEYVVALDTVVNNSGTRTNHTIRLKRWVNMRNKGWYSADGHLHIPRPTAELNPYIVKMMEAEDIHVGNLLQSGKVRNFKMAEQYEFGNKSVYTENGYILAAGQENPRTHIFGHTIPLGANQALFDNEKYLVYRLLFEKAVELGGMNGFAHGWRDEPSFQSPQNGLAIVLPHDLMHFIEVLQFNRAGYHNWYDILNLGFKLAPIAGTDFPCGDQTIPGHERFYTKVTGGFTYENWLEGVESGKTFVTSGPVLSFTVNGKELGSELTLNKGDSALISGNVRFDPKSDKVNYIEIIHNGRAIKKISRVDYSDSINFSFKHTIENTGWFALRGYGDKILENVYNYPFHLNFLNASVNFHSAPIYVNVRGSVNPESSAVALSWLQRILDIKRMLEVENLDFLADKIDNPWDGVTEAVLLSSRETLLKDLDYAENFFRKLILEDKK